MSTGTHTADASTTLDAALQRLYVAHDLPADGGESARWFHVKIGPVTIPLPNPPSRQRAVFIHDTNHVLTGYNAVFSDGEMSIGAFEVGAGCGRVWVAWFLNLALMTLGVLWTPRKLLRAYARGRRTRSLYTSDRPREVLRQMSVAELRQLVRLDAEPLVIGPADVGGFVLWVAGCWLVLALLVTAIVTALQP